MLIGGIAVGYYGYPRATGDIDIWVGDSMADALAVRKVFEQFGLDLPPTFEDIFVSQGKVFRFGRQPLRIEVLTRISGVDFDDCYPRRKKDFLDDIELDIIDLDDLKANKRASGRTNDLDDLAHLP